MPKQEGKSVGSMTCGDLVASPAPTCLPRRGPLDARQSGAHGRGPGVGGFCSSACRSRPNPQPISSRSARRVKFRLERTPESTNPRASAHCGGSRPDDVLPWSAWPPWAPIQAPGSPVPTPRLPCAACTRRPLGMPRTGKADDVIQWPRNRGAKAQIDQP